MKTGPAPHSARRQSGISSFRRRCTDASLPRNRPARFVCPACFVSAARFVSPACARARSATGRTRVAPGSRISASAYPASGSAPTFFLRLGAASAANLGPVPILG